MGGWGEGFWVGLRWVSGMNYLSVCSGIEAATVAWHPLGWMPAGFSEIEPFPSKVLAHHYPSVPNYGDMTRFQEWPDANLDVLVGGTPCQSFSVAGLRKGMADPRGNLALVYLAIADRYRPQWVVWENVPGVLSSAGGRDFGSFLGGLAELGYGWAYRVLDAQFFGVAQRRRRVFVVGCLGDWRSAAAVLFERDCLSGNPAPRREARERPAPTIAARTRGGGGLGTDFDCDGGLIPSLARCDTTGEHQRQDWETCTILPVAHSLRADGFDASEDGTGRGTPLVPISFGWQNSSSQGDSASEVCTPTLDKSKTPAIAFGFDEYNAAEAPELAATMAGSRAGNRRPAVRSDMAVRRLTPEECEALQGFPRGYTDIRPNGKPTADGPRYKALGNSMAVPCMAWIGERIAQVHALRQARSEAA